MYEYKYSIGVRHKSTGERLKLEVWAEDVDAATRSIFARYDEVGGDFSKEIAVYEAAVEAQQQILAELSGRETRAMEELAGLLK